MKKTSLKIVKGFAIVFGLIYLISCAFFYFFQEDLIFQPTPLDSEYVFEFEERFEELNIESEDGTILNNLLFKADSSKGLIFFLHGNGGSLKRWGKSASVFLEQNYDVLILDYRGYGKSEGKINSERELYQDIQIVYNEALQRYDEEDIIVLGYSIGSGLAAKIASSNNPKKLILQAPYYNLPDLLDYLKYNIDAPIFKFQRILPSSLLLKYKFKTNEFIQDCEMPIIIFHGDEDQVIYYGSSLKLQKYLKANDSFITLPGFNHNGITDNQDYLDAMEEILREE